MSSDEEFVGVGKMDRTVKLRRSPKRRGMNREHLNAVYGQMDDHNTTDLSEDGEGDDLLKRAWQKMRRGSESTSLATFEGFLGGVLEELREVRWEQSSLERAVQARTEAQEEHLSRLFQEVESSFQEERERSLREERRQERTLRLEVEKELSQKDAQLQEILQMQKELAENLKQLNVVEAKMKEENYRLKREKEELEYKVESQHMEVTNLQLALQKLQHVTKDERQKRAVSVLKASEGIAVERESLVKQLDLLKAINAQLADEKDAQQEFLAQSFRKSLNISGSSTPDRGIPERRISLASDYCSMSSQVQESRGGISSPPKLSEAGENFLEDGDYEEEMARETTSNTSRENEFLVTSQITKSPPSLMEELLSSTSEGEKALAVTTPILVKKGVFPITSQSEGCSASSSDLDTTSDQETQETTDVAGNSCPNRNRRRPSIRRMSVISPTLSMTRVNATRSILSKGLPCPERVFKVVVLGDSGVGKSSFIHRFCNGYFEPSFSATLGVDFHMKSVLCGDRNVCLQVWDTAGQERYHSITAHYYRKADGVLIMYDVTSEESFKHVRHWVNCVKEGTGDDVLILMLGNKVDQCEGDSERVVKEEEGQKLAEMETALFMEVSAKSGKGVSEAFQIVASLLRERQDVNMAKASVLSGIHPKAKKSCC